MTLLIDMVCKQIALDVWIRCVLRSIADEIDSQAGTQSKRGSAGFHTGSRASAQLHRVLEQAPAKCSRAVLHSP